MQCIWEVVQWANLCIYLFPCMTATAGPWQDREAKDPSGGGRGLPEEQTPPEEINHEQRTEDRDISKGPIKSWLRPPERISHYPYGNPSQPRSPWTQSVPRPPCLPEISHLCLHGQSSERSLQCFDAIRSNNQCTNMCTNSTHKQGRLPTASTQT